LTAQTITELAAHPKIRAIKEATGCVSFASEILDTLSENGRKLDLLSGDDASSLALQAGGATGVVSVTSNLFPRGMVAIQKAIDSGKLSEARELQRRFSPLMRELFVESNPGPVKYALSKMGFCRNTLRLPLVPVSAASAERVDRALARCGLGKGTPA
jgi:4-hydroxy-tetrahydrodipicolinate synthase